MAATDIERGLSTAEVEERIAAGKINRNMELKTKSVKELIIENLCTLFNLINVILSFLVILTGSFKNLTFLFVVFLNTAIGVIQSMRSKKMVDKLTLLTSKKAIAVRDGAGWSSTWTRSCSTTSSAWGAATRFPLTPWWFPARRS
ncbi:MAG: hypothetical protein ACLU0O_06665 [Collinsella sp.]